MHDTELKMACMRLGSKADVFRLEGQSWLSTTGLPSDACIVVEDISFHLHKFPFSSRSQLLEKLILSSSNEKECVLSLPNFPGGPSSFLLVAKFCYNIKFELTPSNVVILMCASEYLKMTEDYVQGNLITLTTNFLNRVLRNWKHTIKALQSCWEVLPFSEELRIVSRCIDSLAKACSDEEDWWYDDVAVLELPLFKRLILAIGSKGEMAPVKIVGAVMHFASKYLPLNGRNRKSSESMACVAFEFDSDRRALVCEIIELLPDQKGAAPTDFLLRLLRTSIFLNVGSSVLEILERRVGGQLDQALLSDLLIPNTGYSSETLYDVDRVQRIVSHFVEFTDQGEDDEKGTCSVEAMTSVANLLDEYLAEVAPDVNLKLEKFTSLAAAIPSYARSTDDGIYHAIDIYLKAHPLLINSEREHLCRLVNCQKLSSEAIAHAAQNECLPLRVIIQVIFFEHIRLRTSVDSCFSASNDSRDLNDDSLGSERGQITPCIDMRERVLELEKECEDMKRNIKKKLAKENRSWNNYLAKRLFSLKLGSRSFDLKSVVLACTGDVVQPMRKAGLSRELLVDAAKF